MSGLYKEIMQHLDTSIVRCYKGILRLVAHIAAVLSIQLEVSPMKKVLALAMKDPTDVGPMQSEKGSSI